MGCNWGQPGRLAVASQAEGLACERDIAGLAGYHLIEKSPRDRVFQLKYRRDAPQTTWFGETRVTADLILDMSIRAKNADDPNATVTVRASCHCV